MLHTRMTIESQAGVASGRPWGIWTSIAWVVVAMAPQQLLLLWIMRKRCPQATSFNGWLTA
jgi:hypothetical protein